MKLNHHLQPEGAIPTRQQFTPGIDFDSRYEVQSGILRSSSVALGSILNESGGTTAIGTFNIGSSFNLTSQLQFNPPYQGIPISGIPYVALYQGTAAIGSNQIWPAKGVGVTNGRYIATGWFDLATWDGTIAVWRGQLIDTSGTSSQTFAFSVRWHYLNYTLANAG
jgi:hypothetical protein